MESVPVENSDGIPSESVGDSVRISSTHFKEIVDRVLRLSVREREHFGAFVDLEERGGARKREKEENPVARKNYCRRL